MVLLNIFVKNLILFFQDFLMNRQFKNKNKTFYQLNLLLLNTIINFLQNITDAKLLNGSVR